MAKQSKAEIFKQLLMDEVDKTMDKATEIFNEYGESVHNKYNLQNFSAGKTNSSETLQCRFELYKRNVIHFEFKLVFRHSRSTMEIIYDNTSCKAAWDKGAGMFKVLMDIQKIVDEFNGK